MESSTPLLSQSNSLHPLSADDDHNMDHLVSTDEIVEFGLGGFGFNQFIHAILVAIPFFFDAQQTFLTVFTDAVPTWHCNDHHSVTCNASSDICNLPRSDWDWDVPSHASTVTDWDLQCVGTIIASIPSLSFFIGCLVGGFVLATLGDSSFGRKNLLLVSSLGMSISAFFTVFSTNIWFYSGMRFITGFFRASISSTILVLSVETVAKKWRNQAAFIVFLLFTVGLLSLPATAYANKSSWRSLYLWTSIPGIIYSLLAYFMVNESPRWLYLHRREAEALHVINKLSSKVNKSIQLSSNIGLIKEQPNVDLYSSIKNLFSRRWSTMRMLSVMALAFGIGMTYYGLLLGVGNLNFDLYLTMTISALLDIPSYAVTFIAIEKCNRKAATLVFCMLCGVCSIICGIVGEYYDDQKVLQVGFGLGSLLCVCGAFSVMLMHTMELFPTIVRNSATSMVRQALIFGGVISPLVISTGRKNHELLCYGLFGLAVIVSGLFVLCLPETRGVPLCDTMEEQEEKDNHVIGQARLC